MSNAMEDCDQLVENINRYYEGTPKHMPLLVAISSDNPKAQRIKRMLKNALQDEEGFRDVCEEFYDMHGKSYQDAMRNAVITDDPGGILVVFNKNVGIYCGEVAIGMGVMTATSKEVALITLKASAKSLAVLSCLVTGVEIGQAVARWVRKEIDGNRAAKIIVDSSARGAGAYGGAVAGAVLGVRFGVVGMFAGGVIGGVAGAVAAHTLSAVLTCQVFCLHPDEATDKAYKFFELNYKATANELNKAYALKSREANPERIGGNQDKQIMVDTMFALIKFNMDTDPRKVVVQVLADCITDPKELLFTLVFLGLEEEKHSGFENSAIWCMLVSLVKGNPNTFTEYTKKVTEKKTEYWDLECLSELYSVTKQGTQTGDIDITSLFKRGSIGFSKSFNSLSRELRETLTFALGDICKPVEEVTLPVIKNSENCFYMTDITKDKMMVAGASCFATACMVSTMVHGEGTLAAPLLVAATVVGVFGYGVYEAFNHFMHKNSVETELKEAYRFLGLERSASLEEIEQAYKKLCLISHPDKGGSAENFNILQKHYKLLRNCLCL